MENEYEEKFMSYQAFMSTQGCTIINYHCFFLTLPNSQNLIELILWYNFQNKYVNFLFLFFITRLVVKKIFSSFF